MRRPILVLLVMISTVASFAQGNDYVTKKELKSETSRLNEGIQGSRKAVNDSKKMLLEQHKKTDSLLALVASLQASSKQMLSNADLSSSRINAIEAGIRKNEEMDTNGMIILGVMMLIFITLAFFYIKMISSRTARRLDDLSEMLTSLSELNEREISLLKSAVQENKDHILFLSDELKSHFSNFEKELETERERTSMFDERLRSLAFESDINMKVQRDKMIAIQDSLNKSSELFEERFEKINSRLEEEIKRLSLLLIHQKEEVHDEGVRLTP